MQQEKHTITNEDHTHADQQKDCTVTSHQDHVAILPYSILP